MRERAGFALMGYAVPREKVERRKERTADLRLEAFLYLRESAFVGGPFDHTQGRPERSRMGGYPRPSVFAYGYAETSRPRTVDQVNSRQ